MKNEKDISINFINQEKLRLILEKCYVDIFLCLYLDR